MFLKKQTHKQKETNYPQQFQHHLENQHHFKSHKNINHKNNSFNTVIILLKEINSTCKGFTSLQRKLYVTKRDVYQSRNQTVYIEKAQQQIESVTI